jgi:hypothetical protein
MDLLSKGLEPSLSGSAQEMRYDDWIVVCSKQREQVNEAIVFVLSQLLARMSLDVRIDSYSATPTHGVILSALSAGVERGRG